LAKVICKKICNKTDCITADTLKERRQSRVYCQKKDVIATALSFTEQGDKTIAARVRQA
jgi:hypothetical protein